MCAVILEDGPKRVRLSSNLHTGSANKRKGDAAQFGRYRKWGLIPDSGLMLLNILGSTTHLFARRAPILDTLSPANVPGHNLFELMERPSCEVGDFARGEHHADVWAALKSVHGRRQRVIRLSLWL